MDKFWRRKKTGRTDGVTVRGFSEWADRDVDATSCARGRCGNQRMYGDSRKLVCVWWLSTLNILSGFGE